MAIARIGGKSNFNLGRVNEINLTVVPATGPEANKTPTKPGEPARSQQQEEVNLSAATYGELICALRGTRERGGSRGKSSDRCLSLRFSYDSSLADTNSAAVEKFSSSISCANGFPRHARLEVRGTHLRRITHAFVLVASGMIFLFAFPSFVGFHPGGSENGRPTPGTCTFMHLDEVPTDPFRVPSCAAAQRVANSVVRPGFMTIMRGCALGRDADDADDDYLTSSRAPGRCPCGLEPPEPNYALSGLVLIMRKLDMEKKSADVSLDSWSACNTCWLHLEA
uniref:Uncharacterized protein n=1 Tax=Anopheles farauti TaxID=69004 RepID=A0A182QJM5_9DIPT